MFGDNASTASTRRSWDGFLPSGIQGAGHDLAAALALAAVAVPEQMATARLAGAPASIGLFVFVAGSLGFFLLGTNRCMSVGADSTIAPIFAGSLAVFGASATPHYLALSAALALLTGFIVAAAGALRLGWIARLLSLPVITGFLAGIAIHIALSQLPSLLGLANTRSDVPGIVADVARNIALTNPFTLAIGLGVFAIIFACEKIDLRLPGALIAVVLAALSVWLFGLSGRGVPVLGEVQIAGIRPSLPNVTLDEIGQLIPIALIVALVVVIQTTATSRSFPDKDDTNGVNRDFVGVGFGNILSGLFGGFPANSSPPRTAIVSESGGESRFAGFCAALIVVAFLVFGLRLLVFVPEAALAGLLLFVAQRIFRINTIAKVATESIAEFGLLVATAAAIVVEPIATGVGIGIALSLLHGVWTATQTRAIEFEKVPGSTVWWPAGAPFKGETLPGIIVIGFQAPLFFLNAETLRNDLNAAVQRAPQPIHAIVLEASSVVELDFSGAQILYEIIRFWKDQHVDFYIARLESLRAQRALEKFGISALLGERHVFHSVDDAIRQIRAA